MKAKTVVSRRLVLETAISVWVLLSLGGSLASALTPISQGYTSSENLALGSIVSLQNGSSDQVTATTLSNANNMLGIIIDSGNSLISLSSGQTSQVQVATSGVEQVLVSNINGNITAGDPITASAISGVGMKATTNTKIIGVAQSDLNSSNASEQSYVDKGGAKHQVEIGEVPVQVNVSFFYKQPDKTIIPAALQNIANSLAGKTVKPLPIIISATIFVITLIVVMSIIYSMIRSSIISVGRNPMSQSAVYRNLIQMSGLVIIILGVSVVAIYLILAKF
ncbi:MAG TPA: hypothetical protein VFN56_04505 [Candidatus Saccharimonadales bacterium]|nr:hypothetical protein [Candidatus Saccharimonadales bacterium]